MTKDLVKFAKIHGWNLTIAVDVLEKNKARFIFRADDKEPVVHPDVFAAANWLSGYALGIKKATPRQQEP